jgi:hypothetical protein
MLSGNAFAMRDPGPGGFMRVGAPTAQYADSMNLYEYVRSSPRMRLDPTGLSSTWPPYPGKPDPCAKKDTCEVDQQRKATQQEKEENKCEGGLALVAKGETWHDPLKGDQMRFEHSCVSCKGGCAKDSEKCQLVILIQEEKDGFGKVQRVRYNWECKCK